MRVTVMAADIDSIYRLVWQYVASRIKFPVCQKNKQVDALSRVCMFDCSVEDPCFDARNCESSNLKASDLHGSCINAADNIATSDVTYAHGPVSRSLTDDKLLQLLQS